MNQTWWLYVALGASLIGLVVASYLAYAQLSINPNVCSISQWFNCDAVLTSSYSKVYGVPMALFGLAWFAVSTLLAVGQLSGKQLVRPMLAWGLLGAVGVLYLNYVEIVKLQTICVYCLSSHLLGITFLAATLLYARTRGSASS